MANEAKVKEEALLIIGQFKNNLPRLVVFDLDYTLWPFFCEDYYKSDTPHLYPHATGIICALKDQGINVAIASRSPAHDIATTFLEKLGIRSMVVAEEIFSSWTHKTEHFQNIHKKTDMPYESMLFFDDEDRNIGSVSKMGVTGIMVDDGITLDAFKQGLSEYSQNSSKNNLK